MFGKNILFFSIIFSILALVIFIVLFNVKKEPQDKKKSFQTGYGSYSQEYSLGCTSESGKCDDDGIETLIQYCQPHPTTGKGCIDGKGNHTYNSVINKKKCNVQCISSKFLSQDGVELSNPGIQNTGSVLKSGMIGRGCNKVTDSKLGLDFTNYFFGSFDESDGKYFLKSCIPDDRSSEFTSYYTQKLTCVQQDQKGSNSCNITCGDNANILNLTGFTDQKTSAKLLNYFPKEINEEGEVRYVCYDINNKDQIEILNYTQNVPDSFVYPNKCYKHTNVKDFSENTWPTEGSNNIFYINNNLTLVESNYIEINQTQDTTLQQYVTNSTGIVSSDYNINVNQDSYVKIRLGTNIMLLNRFFDLSNTGIDVDKNRKSVSDRSNNSIESNVYYISLYDQSQTYFNYITQNKNIDFLKNSTIDSSSTPGPQPVFNVDTSFFDNYSEAYSNGLFFWKDSFLYLPVNLGNFFNYIDTEFSFQIDGNNLLVFPTSLPSDFSSWSTSYYYIILKQGINNRGLLRRNIFVEGSVVTTTDTNYILFNNITLEEDSVIETVYRMDTVSEGFWYSLIQNSTLPIQTTDITTPTYIDFSKSFMSFNIFTSKFYTSSSIYETLDIKDNSILQNYNGEAYVVFGTPSNNLKSYYYPIYLDNDGDRSNYVEVSFTEFPQVKFYTNYTEDELKFNAYFRPQFYNDTPLLYFNEEIKISKQQYYNNYITIDSTNLYFLSELNTINHGMSYNSSTLYNLYTSQIDYNYNLTNNIFNIPGNTISLAVITSPDNVFSQNPYYKTIEIISGRSVLPVTKNITLEPVDINEKKVFDYLEIIKDQNFVSLTESENGKELIIEPERYLTLTADFEVFKSPYVYNYDGSKNFLCYDKTGRALSKGTVKKIYSSTSGTVYTNIKCPNSKVNYEVKTKGIKCGEKGINNNNVLERCYQERSDQDNNFIGTSQTCIVSEDLDKYTVLNNQLEEGLQLLPIANGPNFLKPPVKNTGTFPSYFTKILKEDKIYGPYEEFYIEKQQNNYFLSTNNKNTNFVDNVSDWKRVFTFEQNTYSNPFEMFFEVFPPKSNKNTINLDVGKFPGNTYTSTAVKSSSAALNLSFNTIESGVNSQNYLNQGFSFYYGNQRRNLRDIGLQLEPGQNDYPPYQPGNLSSYIGAIQASNYRDIRNSFAFTSTSSEYGSGPTPRWSFLKYINTTNSFSEENLYLYPESPVLSTFTIFKTINDQYRFRSRLYDSNLELPWNMKIEKGDIFSPDFIYFNTFIYSFILTSSNQYGAPGTVINSIMSKYFLTNSNFNIFIDSSTLTFEINSTNKPSVGDFLLYIPSSFGQFQENPNIDTPYEDVNTFLFNAGGFPVEYPTLQIKKVLSVTPIDNSDSLTVTIEDRDYGIGVEQFNNFSTLDNFINGSQFTIFNLGNGESTNNLISRNFVITNVGLQLPVDVNSSDIRAVNQGIINNNQSKFKPLSDYEYSFSKEYIEFEFEIDSISQSDMENLYQQNLAKTVEPQTGGLFYAYDSSKPNNQGELCQQSGGSIPCYGLNNPGNGSKHPACMPGNAPGDAACFSYLQSPGHTDLNCPAGKYWTCHLGSNATSSTTDLNEYFETGSNFLTPALSARYIKSSISPPSLNINEEKYACLNNFSRQGIFETKVVSQSTRIRKHSDGFYYINEFREDDGFLNPQVERTFSVGDTFDYYNSELNLDLSLAGSKNFQKVMSFVVEEVDVTINVPAPGSVIPGEFSCIFDYKCRTLDNTVSSNPFLQNSVGVSGVPSVIWKSFFLYKETTGLTDENVWDYQLPYSVYTPGEAQVLLNRGTLMGKNTESGFNGNIVFSSVTVQNQIVIVTEASISNNPIAFLDAYKFSESQIPNSFYEEPTYGVLPGFNTGPPESQNAWWPTWIGLQTNASNTNPYWANYSTTYSGDSIRAGLLDTMVLTGTNMVSDTSYQTMFVNLKVSGKPYGIPYFPSTPGGNNEEENIVSHEGFGRIESFSGNFLSFPENTVFVSNKGFEIKILTKKPNNYKFISVSNNNLSIEKYDTDFIYNIGDIVYSPDINLRQFFRNTSPYSVPYLKIPDVNNINIPYTISYTQNNQTTWYYPVFKYHDTGRLSLTLGSNTVYYYKDTLVQNSSNNSNYLDYTDNNSTVLRALKSFNIVGKSVYPQNNFTLYNATTIYAENEIVKFETPIGDQLFKSLKDNNLGNPYTNSEFWKLNILTDDLSSLPENFFYSEIVPDNDFNNFIKNIQNLNNQNFPALIKRNNNKSEFCPKTCTYVNLNENYSNTFLETSIYQNIKYLFETPVLIQNTSNNTILSLGNGPVPKQEFYNTGFLQSGEARNSFLSQYLYYLDLENEEEKYARGGCSGNLFITRSSGTSIDTNVNKFQFSNSVLFNFLPCDLDSQDFIKYEVDSEETSNSMIVTSSDYVSSETVNKFPPFGTSVNVLVTPGDGTFRVVNGHFEYTRITSNQTWNNNAYDNILENTTDSSTLLTISNPINRNQLVFQELSSSGTCYGDIWYNYDSNETDNPRTFGFLIPSNTSGGVSNQSYITLSEGTSLFPNTGVISKNNVSFDSSIESKNYLSEYDVSYYQGSYSSGNYVTKSSSTVPAIEFYVKYTSGSTSPLQPNKAVFYSSEVINDIETIYLPTSSDMSKNIKSKLVGVFGENFFGKINYSLDKDTSILNLQNQQLSPLIFTQLTNDLLLTENEKLTPEVFEGTSTKTVENSYETFVVNFENDGTFSIKPNLFKRPITSKSNELLYLPTNSIDPLLELSSINTESNTIFISKKLDSLQGVSVKLNFSDLLNFNINYSTNPVQIPGKTIIQTQIGEIRQNIYSTYIDDSNFCSIYFEEPIEGLDPVEPEADTWSVKYQDTNGTYPSYSLTSSNQPGPRLYGTFLNSTKLNFNSDITVYLGGDLVYKLDQSDQSNTLPIVFGKNAFATDFGTSNIDMGLPGNQIFEINYYLDGRLVTYDEYKEDFSQSTKRYINISYVAPFDINDYSGASIFFGIPEDPYYKAGGKIKFEYH